MRQFQHVAAHEFPVLYEDFGLSAEGRAALEGYVRDLQDWMTGILTWHREVARYREEELLYEAHEAGAPRLPRQLFGPTGLGTSAARLPVGAVR